VYWDQNTRAARPGSFFATILMRAVPFACLFAAARLGDELGFAVLAGAVGIRLVTAAAMLGYGLRDGEGLQSLWLLPLRDVLGLVWWVLAFTSRTVVWRGAEFVLSADGRLVPDERRMKGKVKANV
jgi:ceramide glucosyltransferase